MKSLGWRNKVRKFFRALLVEILVKQGEGCNITTVGERMKLRSQSRSNQVNNSPLDSVKQAKGSSRGSSPDVGAVFHGRPND